MNNLTQAIVGNFSSWSNQVFSAIKVENPYFLALDILLTAVILYWFLVKIVESKAVRVFYGLIIIFIIYAVAQILNLKVLDWMLKYLSLAILIAIPIIFHPEIRSALERLGGGGIRRLWGFSKAIKKQWIKEISVAVKNIANSKTGGLIVLENKVPLTEYFEKGVRLNAEISSGLIESIFNPASNLRDGAIIISKGEIVSAKVVLPIGTSTLNQLGPRHLAGANITRETDALSIIISTTGRISVAWQGRIKEANPVDVKNILREMMGIE